MIDNPFLETLIWQHYFSGADLTIQPVTGGEENQNFFLSVDGRRYILRLYSLSHSTTGPRRKQDIAFELDFVDHLHQQGVPTPRVILTRKYARLAEAVLNESPRYAALFEYVPGEDAPGYCPGIACSVAETLLQVRRASSSYNYAEVRAWPGDIAGLSLRFYAENRARIGRCQNRLDRLYEAAARGYERSQAAGLPAGIIHGDIKLSNLLFDGEAVKAVLDFDDYRKSYYIEELTRTLLHDLDSPTRNAIRSGYFNAFLEAFQKDSLIGAAELTHLNAFLKARFIYDVASYALLGLDVLVEEVLADPYIQEVIINPAGY